MSSINGGPSVFSSKRGVLDSPSIDKKRTLKAISTINQSNVVEKGIRLSANSSQLNRTELSKTKKSKVEEFPPIMKQSSGYMIKNGSNSAKSHTRGTKKRQYK